MRPVSTFFDIQLSNSRVFGKSTDDSDRVILKEEDFKI